MLVLRKTLLVGLICVASSAQFRAQVPQSSTAAGVPRLVPVAGIFTPADGRPRAPVETVTLSIYAEETGGAPIWQEIQSVSVDGSGRYSLLLGASLIDGLPLDIFATGEARWLGIRFERPDEVEGPRGRLTSVPYALRAAEADTLGGRPASDYLLAPAAPRDSVSADAASVDVPPGTSADAVLPGTDNFLAKYLNAGVDVGTSAVFESAGRVGIGTAAPLDSLHINFTNTNGAVTGLAVQNLGNTAASYSGMLFYDQNGLLGQFQGFNNSTHEYRINNIGRVSPGGAFNGSINFMIGSTSQFFVASSGNIGIGTTAPAEKLHVSGNARIGGGLALGGVGPGAHLTAKGAAQFVATGVVTVSSGSATVTGTGTRFLSELQVGDRFEVAGTSRPVTSIASDTSLTLSSTPGVDQAGIAATVFPAVMRLDNSAGSSQVLVTDQGNLQLGTVSSATPKLLVMQANRFAGIVTDNSITRANTSILTTGPQGADVGAMIGLGGSRGSATVMFAGVRGAKENGTIDDTRGYLAFYTVDDAGGFAERGRITSDGAFGLGTSLPTDRLQVVGDIRVGASGTDGCVKRFDGMGLVGTCVSDQRFKRDITPFGPALSSVTALRPVYYFWRAADYPERHFGDTRAYGLIAQEVEKVLPELVVTNPDGYKAVDYSKLPLLTVQAIKELKAENDELKTRSNAMQSRLAEMERVVKQLLTNRSF